MQSFLHYSFNAFLKNFAFRFFFKVFFILLSLKIISFDLILQFVHISFPEFKREARESG